MTSPLIEPPELDALVESRAGLCILDVRWSLADGAQRAEYASGHLPGAVFVDLDADLADPPGAGGRHPLPAVGRFVETMSALGVDDSSTVVCYDGGPGLSAARAWWLLRYFGHDDVRVLDGGYRAWVDAGYSVSNQAPTVARGHFTARPSLVTTISAQELLDFIGHGTLLDARALERYLGQVEPIDAVAGHIPGAMSAPTTENLTETGTFRSAAELEDRFARLGVDESSEVAVYCGSGVTAAHQILALEVSGVRAALYPGSWSEWITDPARAVARTER